MGLALTRKSTPSVFQNNLNDKTLVISNQMLPKIPPVISMVDRREGKLTEYLRERIIFLK